MSALPRDDQYDPSQRMVAAPFHGPGYHSRIPDGTRVHPTRSSADHALACLAAGGVERLQRAADIFERLCGLQDTDPVSRTYGIWSWTLEEPLAAMDPPDWNWADFIGARIAEALCLHAAALPAPTVARMREALGHAAWSIFRRNVDATYTNIAIMGGVVTAAAGELLALPPLLQYARRRLNAVAAAVKEHGSFSEYNSPTYTVVAIEELDRLARLVGDTECRTVGDALWRHAWTVVSEHFHVPTREWAGPHSRAYSDRLTASARSWLAAATGAAFPGATLDRPHPRPCPAGLAERFLRQAPAGETVVRRFVRRPGDDTVGTTWLGPSACLASVNRDHTWAQRRVLLGYWPCRGEVAVLKMSVLLNGREFPGFMVHQQQHRTAVLTLLRPLFGTGDYHPTLNASPDGRFRVTDLRIRYVLAGPGATAGILPDGRFLLAADPWSALVTVAANSRFCGEPIAWQTVQEEGRACIDGVIHCGAERTISFPEASMEAAAGLELALDAAAVRSDAVTIRVNEDGVVQAAWRRLAVQAPAAAGRFVW